MASSDSRTLTRDTTDHRSTQRTVEVQPPRAVPDGARKAFLSLVGLAGLLVLLQAVWAGLFIREGQDYDATWVEIHARGADLAIGLAIIATLLALVKLRARTDLVFGAGLFAALLVLEGFLGGLVGAHPGWTVVHFPLGMALMAVSVWLPMRAARR